VAGSTCEIRAFIPDGKVGERSVVMFGALKVVAPTCVN
jgi:hypothetical protein